MIVCTDDADGIGTLPPDTQRMAEEYVRALRPDVVLWASNQLRPALVDACARSGAWLVALDIGETGFTTPGPRWLPDPAPATLAQFDRLFAKTKPAESMLRRLGVRASHIAGPGPLSDAGPPLDCAEAIHQEVAETLTGRPVWLAAHLRADEAGDILRAHRQAMRLTHRLLLIIAPATPEDGNSIAQMLESSGLRCIDWDNGDLPEYSTQILLARNDDELGLWYRLAPLAFMGSSLVAGHGGSDPFEAAALGTAILYGPNVGQHLGAYTQLVEAGGARIVRDAESLEAAVQHLIAPDKSAAMAHAGWDVISAGAQLVDMLMAEIGERLDTVEAERGLG
jgi:3-deoxy-D-manno-octulosonic-acid transferase